jgi:DNA-binding NtrC family response regulator
MSIIEQNRLVTAARLQQYLPDGNRTSLPVLYPKGNEEPSFRNEREILYQILFDMKRDVNDLKKLVNELMSQGDLHPVIEKEEPSLYSRLFEERQSRPEPSMSPSPQTHVKHIDDAQIEDTEEIIEESLSIQDKEVELIRKALQKHLGKRKLAAQELGISERTLYRKIKEFGITE